MFDESSFEGKKYYKKEKKRISAKDRSKYKKTDIKKPLGHVCQPDEKQGRVLAIFPECIYVDYEGSEYECTLRGVLKKERTKQKNLIAVGDIVHFVPHGELMGSILYVQPRRSILSRSEHYARKKEQILAANIDQVFITCSIMLPRLKPALIDRYIIASQMGSMDPIIVINKIDLLASPPEGLDASYIEEEKKLFEEVKKIYSEIGIPVIAASAKTGEGLEILKEHMQDKTSVFSGHSGVGKSSLINALIGTKLRVGSIVEKAGKGSHTTTGALLLPLQEGGFCIDTPGIRSFGLWELTPQEIKKYFHEIDALSSSCHFPNCSHSHEPHCAVKEALENKKISKLRYNSYLSLMEQDSMS